MILIINFFKNIINYQYIEYLLFGFVAGIIGALFSIIIRVELAYPGIHNLYNIVLFISLYYINYFWHIYMRRSTGSQPINLPEQGILTQYTTNKYLYESNKFNNKNFSYIYNEYGLNEHKSAIEKHELIESYNKSLYKTLIHPLVYTVNEVDDVYVDIVCTNMTTTNKSVSFNYFNKKIWFDVESINKEKGFQGILKGCFILRVRKDDNSYYFYNLDDFNNSKNIEFIEKKLGGIENVNKIKIVSSSILQNREIPKLDYYHQFSYIVNEIYDQLINEDK